ncbi:MAG: InlB B-repeat-containing protein [Bacilli bacterium]|nr:InlB B-repeat-containing protein [Bacilli bacterium]
MKVVKFLLALLTITSGAIFLTSCGDEVETPHEHTWGEWEVLNPATCSAEGLKGRDCTGCDKYEREKVEKLAHNYDAGTTVVEAGCTTNGVKLITCTQCKDIKTENVEALGHKFENGKCTKCGTFEEEAKSYTLNVEANGGELNDITGLYVENTVLVLPTPSKTNYVFAGWYTTASFDEASKVDVKLVITSDVTIYAKWELVGYEITLDAGVGTVNKNTLNLELNEVFTLEVPVSNEYKFFAGWYLGEQKITDDEGTGLKPWGITEDVTLTALWVDSKEVNGIKFVYQGEYPQSVVTSEEVIAELGKVTVLNDNGYLEYNGNQYAKYVYKAGTSAAYFNNGEKLVDGATYYFRVEPILWRLIDSEKGIVLTENIIDVMAYFENEKTNEDHPAATPNNYAFSDVSSWLNGDVKFAKKNFAMTAFVEPLDVIKMTEDLDNSAGSTGDLDNPYACDDITTFLYLLSYEEYKEIYKNVLGTGATKVSDYAIAKGAKVDNYTMKGEWWLRSPSAKSLSVVLSVSPTGEICENKVNDASIGVRPAVVFKNLIPKGDEQNETK